MAGVAGVVLFAVGAATAPAGRPTTGATTTAVTSTVATTTTATTTPVTTAPVTTVSTTTTAPATTTEPTTTIAPAPTTVPATTSPTTPAPPRTPPSHAATQVGPVAGIRQHSLAFGCPVAAAVLLLPGRGPLLLGAFARASARAAAIQRLVYRSGGAVVTGSDARLSEHGCTASGPSRVRATIASLSLFQGAVTASRVTLTRSSLIAATVNGLAVGGKHTSARSGARIVVPGIGYLNVGSGTHVPVSRDVIAVGALALHLTSTHDGLPPGTVVLIATIGLPVVARTSTRAQPAVRLHAATRRTKRKKSNPAASGEPLKVTPPLAFRHYVFPVAGTSEYIDTYGAFRGDVPGNWHHGDDIFATLGTPVVAVANGTINRVGWEKLGGWRLWVRDDAGDEFYYAHLSGYAPTDLHSNRVRAGEVIGFIGNTGDAFTTAPHLHFEVHPRQLLRLGYNGAVDPTTYLNSWKHLSHVVAPRPVTPTLPTQPQLRSEARYVFRELLAARHLVSHAPSPKQRPHVSIPAGANGPAPTPRQIAHESAPPLPSTGRGSASSPVLLVAGLVGAFGLCVAGAVFEVRRRRGRRPSTPVD